MTREMAAAAKALGSVHDHLVIASKFVLRRV